MFACLLVQDTQQIRELTNEGALYQSDPFKIRQQMEFLKCSRATPLAPVPAIRDTVAFGATPFSTWQESAQNGFYYLSYRAYRITNVTGADWTVNVRRTLDPGMQQTPLTVFLLSDQDYATYLYDHNTTGNPPLAYALPNTLCNSTTCTGMARNLGPSTGVYRLWVSYPQFTQYTYPGSYGSQVPPYWPYADQLVDVTVQAKNWSLKKVAAVGAGARVATEETLPSPLMQPAWVGQQRPEPGAPGTGPQ